MRNLLISTPHPILCIESRRMRGAGHVARMGRGEETCTGFCWKNRGERDNWKDPGVDGRIILRIETWGYGLDRAGSG